MNVNELCVQDGVMVNKDFSLQKNREFIAGVFTCNQGKVGDEVYTWCRSIEENIWGIYDFVAIKQSNNEIIRSDVDYSEILILISYFPDKK